MGGGGGGGGFICKFSRFLSKCKSRLPGVEGSEILAIACLEWACRGCCQSGEVLPVRSYGK